MYNKRVIKSDQPTIFDERKLRAAVSSKADGNVSYLESPIIRAANIAKIAAYAGATPERTVVMDVTSDQANWDTIYEVQEIGAGRGVYDTSTRLVADALVTRTPDLVLLLPTADCCPVVIHDSSRQVVALAHLGWQSTNAGLVSKVVSFLKQHYQTRPVDLRVWVGPCIKAESYVFAQAVQESDPRWRPFLKRTTRGIGIDIVGYNVAGLQSAGVLSQNIQICPVDTATSPDYFSHYRASRSEGKEPECRFATVCMLA